MTAPVAEAKKSSTLTDLSTSVAITCAFDQSSYLGAGHKGAARVYRGRMAPLAAAPGAEASVPVAIKRFHVTKDCLESFEDEVYILGVIQAKPDPWRYFVHTYGQVRRGQLKKPETELPDKTLACDDNFERSIVMELMYGDYSKAVIDEFQVKQEIPAKLLRLRVLHNVACGLKMLQEAVTNIENHKLAQIAHRDLKSDNIFLVAQFDDLRNDSKSSDVVLAKIGDPGEARTESKDNMWDRKGDVLYWAPENRSKLGQSVLQDIYRFGLLAYEVWTNTLWQQYDLVDKRRIVDLGYAPIVSAGAFVVYRDRFAHDKTMPGELLALVRQCWLEKPEGRPKIEEICSTLLALVKAELAAVPASK